MNSKAGFPLIVNSKENPSAGRLARRGGRGADEIFIFVRFVKYENDVKAVLLPREAPRV